MIGDLLQFSIHPQENNYVLAMLKEQLEILRL